MSILANNPKFQAFDSNGLPLVGGKLYTYDAGTTNAKATYTNAALSSANANPIILDARGEAIIYLAAGSYKFVLKDANDAIIWTVDNIDGGASGYGWYPYAVDTGIANAYAISVSPGPTSYAAGQMFMFRPAATNTGASTLNVNGLGAKQLVKNTADALYAGDIQVNTPVLVVYDGSAFQVIETQDVYADGAGNMLFGRSERMRITAAGAVGVGTNAPSYRFHVEHNAASETGILVVNANASGSAALHLGASDRSTNGDYSIAASPVGAYLNTGNRSWSAYVAGAERLGIDIAGALRTGGASIASGYSASGDVTLPAAGKIRALNSAKFWINFNGIGTVAIRSSFNVASVTDNGIGNYTLNLTNALADTNYACVGSAADSVSYGDRQVSVIPLSPNTVKVMCGQTATTSTYDSSYIHVAGFGN